MNTLIVWFNDNKVAANLMMVGIVILGLIAIPNTRRELIPNVSLDQISIAIAYPGADPQTVETSICQRVENAINDLQGLLEITSIAYEGSCEVIANIAEGYAIGKLMEDVKNQVEAIDSFPDGSEKPVIKELTARNRVAKLIVSGPVHMQTLKRLAVEIRNHLLNLASISSVDLEDVKPNEISIDVSSVDLQRYNISFNELVSAIKQNSLDMPSGNITTESGDVLISSVGKVEQADSFKEIILRADKNGSRLQLGDLGKVRDGFKSGETQARFDGQIAVSLDVYRVGDQNIMEVAQALRDYVANNNLPDGVDLYIWQDDSRHFKSRSDLLLKNAVTGLLLLFGILLLFLNARLSFWVSAGIPVAFLGAFAVLPLFDESINIVSLFAFILVLGIIVDDAVVVGESVYSQYHLGERGRKAATNGTRAVLKPVTFAVLTTVVAFIPMLFLPGAEGKLIRAVPIVVIATLLFSLLECLFILPAHLSVSLDNKRREPTALGKLQGMLARGLNQTIERLYKPLLNLVLSRKGLVIGFFIALFALNLALLYSGWIRVSLFTQIEADVATANIAFAEGTPGATTRAAVAHLDTAARELAQELEVETGAAVINHIYAVIGPRTHKSNARELGNRDHIGQVVIELSSARSRGISGEEIVRRWREKTGAIAAVVQLQFSSSLNPPKPDINIEISSRNQVELKQAAKEFKQRLAAFDGVYEIRDSLQGGKQRVQLKLKPVARDLGLSLNDLGLQVRQAFHGVQVQSIQRGEDEVKVWLRYPQSERGSLWHLENMPIDLGSEGSVPLLSVADIEYGEKVTSIKRRDRNRVVTISAFVDPQQNSARQVLSKLKADFLDPLTAASPSLKWSVAGHQKRIEQLLNVLHNGYVLALLAIYIMMAVLFSSYVQPFMVMAAIPFGLLGSFLGHLVLNLEVTLWSFIGMIAVSGVVVNDNLVLVNYINERRMRGSDLSAAVYDAGIARFRPIMLTSLTTFAGLTPLLFETSIQAQFLIPMAASLAFGVMFATLVSLILVPAFYLVVADFKNPLFLLRGQGLDSVLVNKEGGRKGMTLEKAYEHGFRQGLGEGKGRCPFTDEVLASSWEAGWSDARKQYGSVSQVKM